MKVNRKMLEARVEFLNSTLNRPTEYYVPCFPGSKNTFDQIAVGFFHLGASNPGDGWTRYELLETVNEHGRCHAWFSGNNQDMWAYLRGIDDAIRLHLPLPFPAYRKP
jgi:hypothetical protein